MANRRNFDYYNGKYVIVPVKGEYRVFLLDLESQGEERFKELLFGALCASSDILEILKRCEIISKRGLIDYQSLAHYDNITFETFNSATREMGSFQMKGGEIYGAYAAYAACTAGGLMFELDWFYDVFGLTTGFDIDYIKAGGEEFQHLSISDIICE